MLYPKEQLAYLHLFSRETFNDIELHLNGHEIVATSPYLDHWFLIEITRHGVLQFTKKSGNSQNKQYLSGLYPQFKSKSDAIKNFRILVARRFGIDWRN